MKPSRYAVCPFCGHGYDVIRGTQLAACPHCHHLVEVPRSIVSWRHWFSFRVGGESSGLLEVITRVLLVILAVFCLVLLYAITQRVLHGGLKSILVPLWNGSGP